MFNRRKAMEIAVGLGVAAVTATMFWSLHWALTDVQAFI